MNKKAAISAVDILHSYGQTVETFWEGIQQPEKTGHLIETIEDLEKLSADRVRRMDRATQLLSCCTKALIEKWQLGTALESENVGMCTSSHLSMLTSTMSFISRVYQSGPGRANPMEYPNTVLNACSGYACIETQLKGYNNTMAGFGALGEAYDALQLERAQAMVAAGIEEAGEYQQQLFKSQLPGFAVTEGAATVMLESDPSQKVLAWYHGYATSYDAQGLTGSDAHGVTLKSTIADLFKQVQLDATAIDGIILSTGYQPADHGRVKNVIMESFDSTPVYHLESSCGYVGGAAEAFSAAVATLILSKSTWPKQAPDQLPYAGIDQTDFNGQTMLVIVTDQWGHNCCHLFTKA